MGWNSSLPSPAPLPGSGAKLPCTLPAFARAVPSIWEDLSCSLPAGPGALTKPDGPGRGTGTPQGPAASEEGPGGGGEKEQRRSSLQHVSSPRLPTSAPNAPARGPRSESARELARVAGTVEPRPGSRTGMAGTEVWGLGSPGRALTWVRRRPPFWSRSGPRPPGGEGEGGGGAGGGGAGAAATLRPGSPRRPAPPRRVPAGSWGSVPGQGSGRWLQSPHKGSRGMGRHSGALLAMDAAGGVWVPRDPLDLRGAHSWAAHRI